MAVFRIEKKKDFTVMSNHHLRDSELSLKAKGLLSLILSLPEGWDYTTKGLAYICKEGVDSITTTVRELEKSGYITRRRVRNELGQLSAIEYDIHEKPVLENPVLENPVLENPVLENPVLEKPVLENPVLENPVLENPVLDNPVLDEPILDEPILENPVQLNIDKTNKEKINKEILNTDRQNTHPIKSHQQADVMGLEDRERCRSLIKSAVSYDILSANAGHDKPLVDDIIELMTDTLCSVKDSIIIGGDTYPMEVVKDRFLALDYVHIEYVMECMKENRSDIRNIRKYLLATLFNASVTMDSYYAAKVSHDLYGRKPNF